MKQGGWWTNGLLNWKKIKDIRCDGYIIMPNHFHANIKNTGPVPVGADLCVCPVVCPVVCPDDHRLGHPSGEHIGSPLHRVIQYTSMVPARHDCINKGIM